MIKDPLNADETPYDLLGLDPNARPRQVQGALALFMRRRQHLHKLPLAMQARQVLNDPRQRLAVDAMYYSLEGMQAQENREPPPLKLDDFIRVPHLPPEELFSDLDRPDGRADFGPLEFREFQFTPDNRFDQLSSYRLEVTLER